MPKVELERAGPEKREVFANLFQLYVHDFTELWTDLDRGYLDETGLYPPYDKLDSYWSGDPRREPLLIRADGRLAGFALINDYANSQQPCDYSMAEFFVARKYRGCGVAEAAANLAFKARPGQWDVAVTRRNLGAQVFWRRFAASVAAGPVDDIDQNDEHWNGLILRFRIA